LLTDARGRSGVGWTGTAWGQVYFLIISFPSPTIRLTEAKCILR